MSEVPFLTRVVTVFAVTFFETWHNEWKLVLNGNQRTLHAYSLTDKQDPIAVPWFILLIITIIYKINFVFCWICFESREWDYSSIREVFTEVTEPWSLVLFSHRLLQNQKSYCNDKMALGYVSLQGDTVRTFLPIIKHSLVGLYLSCHKPLSVF